MGCPERSLEDHVWAQGTVGRGSGGQGERRVGGRAPGQLGEMVPGLAYLRGRFLGTKGQLQRAAPRDPAPRGGTFVQRLPRAATPCPGRE